MGVGVGGRRSAVRGEEQRGGFAESIRFLQLVLKGVHGLDSLLR